MTAGTGRIRWEPTHRGIERIEGTTGTVDAFLFSLYPPQHGPGRDSRWMLCCRLPGFDALTGYADDPGPLKAEAEQWLERFASSLGAAFPEPEPAKSRKSRAWHADWVKVDRDQDGNAILKHKPTGGLYKILPVEEC